MHEPQAVMETACSADRLPASCCAGFYEQDWVRRIAGECFHPGGEELTRRTVNAMHLPPGARVADLGCGAGVTARMLAQEWGLRVSALDISRANIDFAAQQAAGAGIGPEQVQFIAANAAQLPFAAGEFDAILCECSFSLFTNKPAVLDDMLRVLKPGSRIGITDMATGGALPPDLAEMLAPWTCLSDALAENAYKRLFAGVGLTIEQFRDESAALHDMLVNIKRNLLLFAAGKAMGELQLEGFDLAAAKHWIDRFQAEVCSGKIRYLRFNLAHSG